MPLKRPACVFARPLLTAATALLIALSIAWPRSTGDRLYTPPGPGTLTLWAWERSENLSFLKSSPVSVAYYAGTIFVRPDMVFFKPRLQELKVPACQSLCPVLRIENTTLPQAPGKLAVSAMTKIVKTYLKDHQCKCVQLDYDATANERAFYLALLKRLRGELSPGTHLAITALASWCLDDRWLTPGSADEAIVMLFSMGRGEREVLDLLARKQLDAGSGIDLSIGISANENYTNERLDRIGLLRQAKHLYIFDSLPWTHRRFETITNQVLEAGGAAHLKL
jgi:hypothetical protein